MLALERETRARLSPPVRIALVYLFAAAVWIVISDRVVEALPEAGVLQTIKGSVFVALSALLIWWLVRRETRRTRDLEVRFNAIADQEVVGVYLARGAHLIYANEMLCRMLRYPRDVLLSLPVRELLDKVERERIQLQGNRLEEAKNGTSYQRLLARRADGTTVPVHVLRRHVDLADGPAWAGIVLDATHIEALEARLRQTAKLEALGQVTGSVAHDFNNLLTAMMGQLDLALLDLPIGDPVRLGLSGARDTARRAAVLTGQLLTFTRSRVSRAKALDVNASIRELGGLLDSLSGSTVVIRYDLGDPLPPIHLDPACFDQMIVNLFVNAKQALDGPGEITVRTREARRSDERRVSIEVRDTGRGIPKEVMGRMFEPFFTTKEHGTGLGLATVRGIVDQGGGSLEADSELGKGTTLRALFPVSLEPVSPSHREPPSPPTEWRAGRSVLVVDDEPAVRRVIAAALRRQGYKVTEAAEAKAALKLFLNEPVDLVILDVMLPGQSGIELARELLPLCPELKVLLITGYAPKELIENEASLTAFPFLEKPFSIDDLIGSVDRFWRERNSAA